MQRSVREVSPSLLISRHIYWRPSKQHFSVWLWSLALLAIRFFLIIFCALTKDNTLYRTIACCYSSQYHFIESSIEDWFPCLRRISLKEDMHSRLEATERNWQIFSAAALSRFAGQSD
jgi:hypothetical protein